MINRVTVLLAGSSSFFRAYLRIVIEGRPGFRVVGEAFSPSVAIAIAAQKRPQVVLLDYRHSGKVFFDSIRRVTEESGGACLLIGSAEQGPLVTERAMALGAAAVLVEDDDPDDLIRRIEEVCS